jgi:leucyl-tRNA synthetase
VPAPEKDLPIKLPENAQFTGQGNPLANTPSFVNARCPKCKGKAKRETDTMDTFVDSSWYFLRYCSNKEKKHPFNTDKIAYWMPVDQYIGGAEHAVMHLLYARFFTKVLRDLDLLKFNEPFKNLFNQGMVLKGGEKMSKSAGNIVSQEDMEEKYGIDTARLFMLFVAGPGKDIEFTDEGVQGSFRFLQRLELLYGKPKAAKADKAVESKIHSTLKSVTEYLDSFELNKAIIEIMQCAEFLEHKAELHPKALELLTLMLSPFVPHVAEELWEKLGKKPFACTQKWPKFDSKKINAELEYQHTLYEKLKTDVNDVLKLTKILKPMAIKLFVAEQWKHDMFKEVKEQFGKTKNPGEMIKRLMQRSEFKKHGEAVSKLAPKLMAEPARMPSVILGQKKELAAFQAIKDQLAKDYSCSIEIVREQDSKEQKAKNAMPGKPALVVV